MSVREELEEIRSAAGGILHPETVVSWAREHQSSSLHGWFCWDDTEAARRYRVQQAADLIRVQVTYLKHDDTKVKVRAYVSLTTDRKSNGGYRAIADVIDDSDLLERLLSDAKAELASFREKFSSLNRIPKGAALLDAVRKAAA